MKIFILSPNIDTLFAKAELDQIKKAGDLTLVKEIKPFDQVNELYAGTEERILALDPDFCDWTVPNEAITNIPNLKGICLQTTSFSWIDIDYLKSKYIPVMNLRGFSSLAVAEWAILIAMNVARKVPLVIKNDWKQDFTLHRGIELKDKIVGIVGLGNIGTRMAEICKGMGMNVIYWSKTTRNKKYEYTDLKKLMKTADLVLPAVAKNAQTKGLITDEMIKSMKTSAIFVSIVHEVYNHDLLLKQVKEGKLYGYGFEQENPEFNKYEGNVWAGPELAWATDGSMRRNAEQWTQSIVKAANGKYPTRVN